MSRDESDGFSHEALREAGFSDEEIAAIDRDEAGVYNLSPAELAAITDSGQWPVHPDPMVVVVHEVAGFGNTKWVRWWRRAQ